jgi:hypothetical protein
MIGKRDPRAALWNYRVNLDKRVRNDHPLRRINAVLDLSFVDQAVGHTYGRRGNKSVPPEVILRMMLPEPLPSNLREPAGTESLGQASFDYTSSVG